MEKTAAQRTAQSFPNTLVVGLGKTGLSCIRYLVARGVPVAVTDSREQPPGLGALEAEFPEIPRFLGGFADAAFRWAERLVVSPGVSLAEPPIARARAAGLEVLGDVELFAREAAAPGVAITGSNGKSTVTSLLGEMARCAGVRVAVGGNLGKPALELLDASVDLYVLELSSFQLETTESLALQGAAVLNVSADHLDRYPDLRTYAAAKARILRRANWAVLNRADPWVRAMGDQVERAIYFAAAPPEDEQTYGLVERAGEIWLVRGKEALLPASALTLQGRHQLANALAALALAEICGLDRAACLTALRTFRGLPHRCQCIATRAGVRWVDDSKATNPGATIAALQGLGSDQGKLILIAGGMGKGADFSELGEAIARWVHRVVLLGQDGPQIERAIRGRVPVVRVATMEAAVHQAQAWAQPGDLVLLSPACASFDLFQNFAHRGQVFAAAVQALPQEQADHGFSDEHL